MLFNFIPWQLEGPQSSDRSIFTLIITATCHVYLHHNLDYTFTITISPTSCLPSPYLRHVMFTLTISPTYHVYPHHISSIPCSPSTYLRHAMFTLTIPSTCHVYSHHTSDVSCLPSPYLRHVMFTHTISPTCLLILLSHNWQLTSFSPWKYSSQVAVNSHSRCVEL